MSLTRAAASCAGTTSEIAKWGDRGLMAVGVSADMLVMHMFIRNHSFEAWLACQVRRHEIKRNGFLAHVMFSSASTGTHSSPRHTGGAVRVRRALPECQEHRESGSKAP